MQKQAIAGGTAHQLPDDLRKALAAAPPARTVWDGLTPLARNEWICWTISVKQEATRKNHIERTITELQEGMRRPCCWMGCIHRSDKAISPSVQWVLGRKSKRQV
jgi:bacteriocin resistance YdeI/OmpD-like protein